MRWVLVVTGALVGVAWWQASGPPDWESYGASLLLGIVFAVVGVISVGLMTAAMRDIVDRNWLATLTSCLLLSIWAAVGGAITLTFLTSDSVSGAGRWVLTSYSGLAFPGLLMLSVVGGSHRIARWTWFRPGLAVRVAVHRHCHQRVREFDAHAVATASTERSRGWLWRKVERWRREITGGELRPGVSPLLDQPPVLQGALQDAGEPR
jgi:hypothetical protein